MTDTLYKFGDSDINALVTRLRRIESGTGYLRRGAYVTTTSKFVGVTPSALDDSGNVKLDSSSVAKVGSTAPSVISGNFSFVATENSATIYWDGTNGSQIVTVKRTDLTNEAIAGGSITVSGLAANTTYYAYPFKPVSASSCMGVGWAIGDTGVPQILFSSISTDALSQQLRQDRYPLTTGALSVSTTVAGAGTGTATYVGGGGSLGFQDFLNIDGFPI